MSGQFTLIKMAKMKSQTITSVGEDAEILKPSYTAGGNVHGAATVGNRPAGPHTVRPRVLTGPNTAGPFKRSESMFPTKTCPQMSTAALFIIDRRGK